MVKSASHSRSRYFGKSACDGCAKYGRTRGKKENCTENGNLAGIKSHLQALVLRTLCSIVNMAGVLFNFH